ncbi:MAG: hypothetical protein V2A61_04850 [Calditrichota bacterium]
MKRLMIGLVGLVLATSMAQAQPDSLWARTYGGAGSELAVSNSILSWRSAY